MILSKRLIASLGVLMLGASALVQAAPPDQRGNSDHNGPQGMQQQGNAGRNGPQGKYQQQGNAQHGQQKSHRAGPPQDFTPVRKIIHDNHGHFARGANPPPGIHLVRGKPLPHGYHGERLGNRALAQLPHYEGYEWRRSGPDVILIAVGTGIVYQILSGVLN